jgi:hypothetical protein
VSATPPFVRPLFLLMARWDGQRASLASFPPVVSVARVEAKNCRSSPFCLYLMLLLSSMVMFSPENRRHHLLGRLGRSSSTLAAVATLVNAEIVHARAQE